MNLNIPDFSEARVLVVGDLMLDRYWHGLTQRISPEAPVPVVSIKESEERAGGAGNVALNIAKLGGHVALIGLIGKDDSAHSLNQILQSAGVATYLISIPEVDTITKLRVISRNQQLIRLDFENGFGDVDLTSLLDKFSQILPHYDVVVLSDYAKGTLRLVQELIALSRSAGKPVLVDPKNLDVSLYSDATLITPNLNEFQAMVGPCSDDTTLVNKGHKLINQLRLQALLITRGERGMTLLRPNQPELHLPSQAREVFDVTGAGDTVIATTAVAIAAGLPIDQAVTLANAAAGIVVGKLGTATISARELEQSLISTRNINRGHIDEENLIIAVELARSRCERIVMTNGCFDILHAGHVSYLESARALGDRLIVAINDDKSVRMVKGNSRPFNKLNHRIAVLAALHCVDWVVAFSEETPERLICRILPDFLVKGGDYHPDEIAGSDCVRRSGGQVKVLNLVAGLSTTKILKSLELEE
ncbi:bifunctional D-glycero-beta-D-manno-heptose-7-phosphate kinase/D-glycero-beta-D-manno-heptose 1-phosphate adenylyltransferase HldE [Cylindrospermopsis raciborskii DSH]|uniref:bifunctional D-glycero-beta-D-manno-heptose-7-phosphate kinase/D-glycero-beta-D-manno-heptose 1-phosphate adenylyltransferase HldE n=1 Tax=Cylindrospermopsis raciborskii TaxID=77022 RepID=UPI001BAB46C4|nr:bifunctional D-glycero-beta-D-manno-heptose-7-phosphate kinase/D-glycero-beta-D-manno-heptose 1-phosphate adenylyltransferase HldE [Cylindrospermopsis raciborskii]